MMVCLPPSLPQPTALRMDKNKILILATRNSFFCLPLLFLETRPKPKKRAAGKKICVVVIF